MGSRRGRSLRGVSVAGFSALSYRYDFTRNLLLCQDIAVLHFSNHYPLYPTRSVCRLLYHFTESMDNYA